MMFVRPSTTNDKEYVRYNRLESFWILTNISIGTNKEIINEMLEDRYNLIESVNSVLKSDDVELIEQVMWLVSNISGEDYDLNKLVLSKTYIIEAIA